MFGAAGPPSVPCPPAPCPLPPPAPRGARGQTAVMFGGVIVVVVPRPPAARPPDRPPPAPHGTRTSATALPVAPCAAVPEKGQEEIVGASAVEVERPMCRKRGGLVFKIVSLAKYGFSMAWQGAGWGGLWSPPPPWPGPFRTWGPRNFSWLFWFFNFPLPPSSQQSAVDEVPRGCLDWPPPCSWQGGGSGLRRF